mmetsp:Transcript_64419/g.203544  ORF Transcript_64419/g.203544 Transcript_64419/m.203544 type:complete len:119 (+) Transcript_64419:198-554(+)|eukprot:CAMPEP_0182866006 /NCGR_PEP_ID=MMETSP0034_2-20130328/7985_1 /TAXON_ID=156128 /ORGANISM="Nephroselmis pyriformis, Strain CCMP717" /LENGTH=118 /DNA_ID=CAMNT_0024998329 /DNA_START=133 /DNA_END=489 /DNA_ORIENTATION=-
MKKKVNKHLPGTKGLPGKAQKRKQPKGDDAMMEDAPSAADIYKSIEKEGKKGSKKGGAAKPEPLSAAAREALRAKVKAMKKDRTKDTKLVAGRKPEGVLGKSRNKVTRHSLMTHVSGL